MPSPALPDPAAVLPGEADLLAAVVANLADDTPKLVYADWLEEHDDPARAAYLRAFVAALRSGDPLPPGKPFPEPWRDLVGVSLVWAARSYLLGRHAGRLLGLARPGFLADAKRVADTKLPVGASKFGGAPDLPGDIDWPANDDDAPLAFLGQVNLADVAPSPAARDLPAEGILSVFYDAAEDDYVEEADGWRVFLLPAAAVARRDPPAELPDEARFRACRLTFAEVLMLPGVDSPYRKTIGCPADDFDLRGRYEGRWPATGASGTGSSGTRRRSRATCSARRPSATC